MAIHAGSAHKSKVAPKKVTAEVYFAQKLAANEKKTRDKTIRKLRKWLTARSSVSVGLSEEELLKLWKGLFYCMWMSDKPLVQEELAETISQLIHVLKNRNLGLLFYKVSLITVGREWMNIDKWRVDKFLLFARRLVRHGFRYIADNDWDIEEVKSVAEMVSNHVVNANKNVTDILIPLGIQTHVTDIWLEELAKVGGEDIPSEVTVALLEPFIRCIVSNSDSRLKDVIRKRVFYYLMRQSDVGIEYELAQQGIVLDEEDENAEDENNSENEGKSESEENSEIEEDSGNEEDDSEHDENDSELEDSDSSDENVPDEEEGAVGRTDGEEGEELDQIVDPRAGGIDVTLPQLEIDYNVLAARLFEVASLPEVRNKNRKFVYELVKKFKDLAAGVYPLSLAPVDVGEDVTRSDVSKAVHSSVREESKYLEKNRKEKLAIRTMKKTANKVKSEPVESHIPDNFVGAPTSKKAKQAAKRQRQSEIEASAFTEEPSEKKLRKKKKKAAVENSKVELDANETSQHNSAIVFEADQDWGPGSTTVVLEMPDEQEDKEEKRAQPVISTASFLKASLKRINKLKKKGESGTQQGWTESLLPGETEIVVPNKRYKGSVRLSSAKVEPPAAKKTKAQRVSGSPKKVNFALASSAQEPHEYADSVRKSPAVPHDPQRRPAQGVLKPGSSPTRAVASDFF